MACGGPENVAEGGSRGNYRCKGLLVLEDIKDKYPELNDDAKQLLVDVLSLQTDNIRSTKDLDELVDLTESVKFDPDTKSLTIGLSDQNNLKLNTDLFEQHLAAQLLWKPHLVEHFNQVSKAE